MIWSTTPDLFVTQLTFVFISLLTLYLVSRLDPSNLKALSLPAYILSLFLLVLTFILGRATRGSVRWIEIGPFRLQPSELAKPLLILHFSSLYQSNKTDLKTFFTQLLNLIPPAILIFIQPDLGSTIVVILIWFGILIGSHLSAKFAIGLIVLGLSILPLSTQFLQPYQIERIETFTNPYIDPKGSGYNVIQAMIAVGSGKFFGKGVRQGTQSHLKFLPERHTDFAFASFSEEFGFLGSALLVISYATFLYYLIISSQKQKGFNKLVIVGVFWNFFTQFIVNIGMNLGIFPVTGITLPLFSYGGSSLLSLAISLGFLLSINKKALHIG